MNNKYFKYWFGGIGLFVATSSVLIQTSTGGSIISGLLSSLIFSLPTAFIFSMLHKWYREMRPKRIVGPTKITPSGKSILTLRGYRTLKMLKFILVAGLTLFMFNGYLLLHLILALNAIGLSTGGLLELIGWYGFIFPGMFVSGGIALIITLLTFSFVERKYLFDESMPKFKAWKIPVVVFLGDLLFVFIVTLLPGADENLSVGIVIEEYFSFILISFFY